MELNNQTNNSITLHSLCNIVLNFKLKEEPLFFRKDSICSDKFILNCSEISIYTIKNYPESTREFAFKIEYIKIPTNHATSLIIQKANMLSAYKKANVLDKQTLTLDPLYAADFSEQPLESKIIHICFAKRETFTENVIAVVSNYGQCEIITLDLKQRLWDKTVLQVNNLWLEIFPSSLYFNKSNSEFEFIRKYIEDYTITTCCWLDNITELKQSILFCSTISGWIIAIKINEEPWNMELLFKFQTDLYKINYMQSYSYVMKNGFHKTIIICGDINGIIKLYKLNENNKQLIEMYTLWNKKDHMSSKNYIIHYCTNNELLFLTTTKSSHFLIFIISVNDDKKIFSKTMFCDTQIIGYDSINPYEYLICTTNGCTKHLKITPNNDYANFTLLLTNITNDFETENYISMGMLATPNKVGWLFLSYPHKTYMQSQNIKNYGCISVYTINTVHPLQILENIPSKNYSQLENYNDCYEIIRLRIHKNILIENYAAFTIEPIELTENFLHRLRIQLVLTQGFGGYNLRKVKNRGENIEFEKNNIILTIKTLSAYWRLKYLQTIVNLSNFQKLSVKSLRRILYKYLDASLTYNYINVQNILRTYISDLLVNTKSTLDNIEENCRYCRQNIDIHIESCTHDFPRCCLSFVQIPNITMRKCERCGSVALNDDILLKEILFENEEIKCTFCTLPLIINK